MSKQVNIEVKAGLNGNIQVTIEHRGRAIVLDLKGSEDDAREEAEEVARRMFQN
jgi:hypothetical protein